MHYKRQKKSKTVQHNQSQKKGVKSIIPSEWINKHSFDRVIVACEKEASLSSPDQYSYGYALLKTQQFLKALIIWWPLIAKSPTLDKDCENIADIITQSPDLLLFETLNQEEKNTLFLALKKYKPSSEAFHNIQKNLFEAYFKENNYASLERLYKLDKNVLSHTYVENRAKLAFFQPQKKMVANPAAYISLILTGAASLIAHHPIYHEEASDVLQLLSQELRTIFLKFDNLRTKGLSWDLAQWMAFVNIEMQTVLDVLTLLFKTKKHAVAIIPTPYYLKIYDGDTKSVAQQFLPWLKKADSKLYVRYTCDSVITETRKTEFNPLIPISFLDQPDPFEILDVKITANKSEIIQAMMQLTRQFPEKMGVFRKAQDQLFSLPHRFLYHFLNHLSWEDSIIVAPLASQSSRVYSPLRQEFFV